jgi:uncharacterized protein YqgC (DUF456 family)
VLLGFPGDTRRSPPRTERFWFKTLKSEVCSIYCCCCCCCLNTLNLDLFSVAKAFSTRFERRRAAGELCIRAAIVSSLIGWFVSLSHNLICALPFNTN